MKKLLLVMFIFSVTESMAQEINTGTLLSNKPVLVLKYRLFDSPTPHTTVKTQSRLKPVYQFSTKEASLLQVSFSELLFIEEFILLPPDTLHLTFERGKVKPLGSYPLEQELFSSISDFASPMQSVEKDTTPSIEENIEAFLRVRGLIYRQQMALLKENSSRIRPEMHIILDRVAKLIHLDRLLAVYNSCLNPNFRPTTHENEFTTEVETLINELAGLQANHLGVYHKYLGRILTHYANYISREVSEEQKLKAKFKGAERFNGLIKDIYLTRIMQDKAHSISLTPDLVEFYFNECSNTDLHQQVRDRLQNWRVWLSEKDVETTPLISVESKETSWQQLIEKNKGKIVYIDFWASWCAGCRQNLPMLKDLQKKYPTLQVILISIDKDRSVWQKAITAWPFGSLGDHYLLDPQTKLATILAKPSIPRHTLIGPDGVILSIDSFSPSNPQLYSLLDDLFSTINN